MEDEGVVTPTQTSSVEVPDDDDKCRYAFAEDDEEEEPSNANASDGVDHGLVRQDSSRSMFTFATSATDEKGASGCSSPSEPPGTHLERTQSEPPGRKYSRGGYRSSPNRRRSSSPLPGSRFQSPNGPLLRRSTRDSQRTSVPFDSFLGNDESDLSREIATPLNVTLGSSFATRPTIGSFLGQPSPEAGSASIVDSSHSKPSTPNPVAVLISDAIRSNDLSEQQEGEAKSPAIAPLLCPSKLRRDSRSKKPKPSKVGSSTLATSVAKMDKPNPVALLVADAIRQKKVARPPAPVKLGKPNPVALLIADAVQKRNDKTKATNIGPKSDEDVFDAEAVRKKDGSRQSCNQQSIKIADIAPGNQSGPDPSPSSESNVCKNEEARSNFDEYQTSEKSTSSSDEKARSSSSSSSRRVGSSSEASSRRRDRSPTKRRKSKSKDDPNVDRSERRRRKSPEKTALKRGASEGQENANHKSLKTKGDIDELLSEAPVREVKRRNSTGSLDPSNVLQVGSSTHRSQSRTSPRRTRSPSRARSPTKASSSSRERTRTKDESLGTQTLHTSASRARSLAKASSSTHERTKYRNDSSATKAMHTSLSSLGRKPRSPILRTMSDDKNHSKSLHMSLSGLFESESPPRVRSRSRSLRVSRSNLSSQPEEPTPRSSTHRRKDIPSPSKHSPECTTNPSSVKPRRSQSPPPTGREPKTRQAPSSSRLHRNKERSSSLKTPKTCPSRPRRSLMKLQNLPKLSLDDEDERSINLEYLGESSHHTKSLQLDISNPCLVETMFVATLLSSNDDDDSEPELFDSDLFQKSSHRSAHGPFGRTKSDHPKTGASKSKTSLMSSLRDLSPRRLRADRTVEAG